MALSALVHGYAGQVELAKVVNLFYLQATGLHLSVYFDWVPSKANIADLPSRSAPREVAEQLRGYRFRSPIPDSLVVPDMATWHGPIEDWLDRYSRES